jgi:hypothetical protein
MNCLTARQTLELARPAEPAPDAYDKGAVDEASRHVDACPACQTAVRRQKQFDAKVGAMVRDVPVPADLKARLMARLEASAQIQSDEQTAIAAATNGAASITTGAGAIPVASQSSPAAVPPPARSRGKSRRRWLSAAALAAACVVAGFGTWSLWPAQPSIDPHDVAGRLAKDGIDSDHWPEFVRFASGWPEFVRFARGPALRLPATMITQPLALAPRKLDTLDVAVYFFTLPGRGKTTLAGRLAVIPKRYVNPRDLPLSTSFLVGATPEYRNGFCITSWVEGEFVYVLCLTGSEDELHRLVPNRSAA